MMPPHENLEFPMEWKGRVICSDSEQASVLIAEALKGLGFRADPRRGNRSQNGKYVTYHVSLTVADRETLDHIHHALAAIPSIRMVL